MQISQQTDQGNLRVFQGKCCRVGGNTTRGKPVPNSLQVCSRHAEINFITHWLSGSSVQMPRLSKEGPLKSVDDLVERVENRLQARQGSLQEGTVAQEEVAVASLSPTREKSSPLKECYNVLRWHFEVHGFEFHTSMVEAKTLLHWEKLCQGSGGSWLKLMKYKLPAFFAAWMNNPVAKAPFPDRDDPKRLFSSRKLCRKFQQILLNQSEEIGTKIHHLDVFIRDPSLEFQNFRECVVGVNYVKKGLPRPDREAIESGISDTVQELFAEYSIPNEIAYVNEMVCGTWEGFMGEEVRHSVKAVFSRETISTEIERTVAELFHGHTFSRKEAIKQVFPSLRANTTSTVKDGGMFGLLSSDPEFRALWMNVTPQVEEFLGWVEGIDGEDNDVVHRGFEKLKKLYFPSLVM